MTGQARRNWIIPAGLFLLSGFFRRGCGLFLLERSLGCGQTGNGHAVRRARDIAEAELVAELHGVRITAMFATDAELDVRAGAAALGNCDFHELSNAGCIERGKGILLEDVLFHA